MSERRGRFFLLALSLPLLGCPYDSKGPLASPTGGVIEAPLLGAWRCVSGEDAKSLMLSVFAFDDRQYYINQTQGDERAHFRAFSTPVKGVTLLSVQELEAKGDSGARKWFFVRYGMPTPTVLHVRLLREEPFKGVADSGFREVLEKGVEREDFYQDYVVCAKVVEKAK